MIETLPDGRRKYTYPSGDVKYYTPKRTPPPANTYLTKSRRRYELPQLLPDDQRVMPETVPHEVIRKHVFGCACKHCANYGQLAVRLKRRHRGLQTISSSSRTISST